jgi:hypothetical protein
MINMKRTMGVIFLLISLGVICSFSNEPVMNETNVYHVRRLKKALKIDANRNKPQWRKVQAAEITNYMGTIPDFRPEATVKMLYDKDNIYVIFYIKDRYVRCITDKINGPVWQDSAVEFFFSPDPELPLQYFNLETNCGGTPLLHYNTIPSKESKRLTEDDISQIKIAGTLPKIIDPEISNPVEWTLEYRIPLAILEKYAKIARPSKGIEWKANFYKIAENNSNPHYITWSRIENIKPDFHRPQFFGRLIFD